MKILFTLMFLSVNALAMDRWSALSMIESANCDSAVGQVGEITRYQIRPELWPGGDPRDARAALVIARHIMAARMAAFQQDHGRPPTDFEFYILWNAPSQIDHPHHAVVERAQRFVNLIVDSGSPKPASTQGPSVSQTRQTG
jgi:hypothetical protein